MDHQDYPEAVWVPLTPTGTMTSGLLANETDSLVRTALTTGAPIPIDRYPQTITNTNIITFQSGAADAAIDQTFQWIPEASGNVNKFFINIGLLMSMTAFTDNENIWDTSRVTITRVGGGDIVFDRTYNVNNSVGAVEHHEFIIADSVLDKSFKIREGNPLDIRIRTTNTKTITNTSAWGIMPFFPQQIPAAAADILLWTYSGIQFYISRDQIE